MEKYQLSNGRFIAATFHPTKKRFKAALTINGMPNEAHHYEDLKYSRSYGSIESLNRALRKQKQGKLK